MAGIIQCDSITDGSASKVVNEIVDTSSNQVCKAWVNWNQAGAVAIKSSFNINSITDTGVGLCSFSFTNNMPSTNYTTVGGTTGGDYGMARQHLTVRYKGTSGFSGVIGWAHESASGMADYDNNSIVIFSN